MVTMLGCSDEPADSSVTSPTTESKPAGSGAAGTADAGKEATASATAGASGRTPPKDASNAGGAGSGGAPSAGASGSSGAVAAGSSGMGGSSGAPAPSGDAGQPSAASGADLDMLKSTGIDKYVGAAKPNAMQPGANGETTYTFDIADGPECLRGGAYSMSTRKQDSQDLLIYLQGGGSCSSAVCSATTTASPAIPSRGITSASDASNPVAGWNVVYVPYCDGSLHLGDKDHEMESPPRYHHGLRNLSAALDVGVANLPKPRQILLAGSSAGGLGTVYASVLVRLLYPDAKLFVFNDSGSGISTPDGMRAALTRDEWGTGQLIPASCPDCKASPHSTPIIGWDLQNDPELRVAFFSAYEDTVLANTFLMIGGPAFKQALLDETGKVVMAYPDRAKRFFIEGTQHTTAGSLDTTAIQGVNIGQWLGYMLAGDAKWTDTLQ
jgi:hypothetical protein